MSFRRVVAIAAGVSLLAACGTSEPNQSATPVASNSATATVPSEPPLLVSQLQVDVIPQDVTSLPQGKVGDRYNAIPPCDLIDSYATGEILKLPALAMAEQGYNAEYEMRICASEGDNGAALRSTTRVDRPGLSALFDKYRQFMEANDQHTPYSGMLPGNVRECFWTRYAGRETGMACQLRNGVAYTVEFESGLATREQLTKLMGYGLSVSLGYYDKYHIPS